MSDDGSKGLTRSTLYDAVWTEPIYRLAPRCGMTDVGMAKLCRRYRIPVPGRGYWQKRETGSAVPKRPALRRYLEVEADRVLVWLKDGATFVAPSKPEVATTIDPAVLHSAAALTWARLRSAKPSRKDDMLEPGYLGMKIMPDMIERVVLIIDALAKEFEARGCAIGNDSHGIGLVARGVDTIKFELVEEPITGRLSLHRMTGPIGRRTWADGARTRLERLLGGFVVGIEATLEKLKEEREKRERQQAASRRIEQRGTERRTTAERERQIEKRVNRAAIAWERANRLRMFAGAIDAAVDQGKQFNEATVRMRAEAREIASRIDPLETSTPPRPETIDYMRFRDWYTRLLVLLGQQDGYKQYGAKAAFEARMTPEEAADEVDWKAYWY